MNLNNLQYFVGRVCTIFTGPINRSLQEKQLLDYFIGTIEAIDELGILTTHVITGCKNFYFFSNIFSISEEQLLDPANPKHAQIIEDFKKQKSEKYAHLRGDPEPPPVQENKESPFVDVDAVRELAKQAKKTMVGKS